MTLSLRNSLNHLYRIGKVYIVLALAGALSVLVYGALLYNLEILGLKDTSAVETLNTVEHILIRVFSVIVGILIALKLLTDKVRLLRVFSMHFEFQDNVERKDIKSNPDNAHQK